MGRPEADPDPFEPASPTLSSEKPHELHLKEQS